MLKGKKTLSAAAILLLLAVVLILLDGGRERNSIPSTDTFSTQGTGLQGEPGAASSKAKPDGGSNREFNRTLKNLEIKLKELEMQRVVATGQTVKPALITEAMRKSYNLPVGFSDAFHHIDSVLIRAPNDHEKNEIISLISDDLGRFAGEIAVIEVTDDLIASYLNYPNKFKIVTQSKLSLALRRDSFSVTEQDTESGELRDVAGGTQVFSADGNMEPVNRDFRDARLRYGRLFGFRE